MKRFLRIFGLSKNEQRVVLIITFALVAISFIGYEYRANRPARQPTSVREPQASPTPVETVGHQ
jgi:hypothetical protein